jgi:hypothetical protein
MILRYNRANPDNAARGQSTAGSDPDFRTNVRQLADRNRRCALPVVSPERRISSSEYCSTAYFNPISKIDLVSGSDHAAIAENEPWVSRIHNVGIGNRIDLVESNYFRKSAQRDFVAAANNIQVSDARMVSDDQLLNSDYEIEVPDLNVIGNLTVSRIKQTTANADPFSDLVSKEQTITWSLDESWPRRQECEH